MPAFTAAQEIRVREIIREEVARSFRGTSRARLVGSPDAGGPSFLPRQAPGKVGGEPA